MRRIRGIVFVVLVLLVGCTTSGVRTTSMAMNDKQEQKTDPYASTRADKKAAAYKASGIAYYLPMRYAKVTFTRQKADSKAEAALIAATAAKKAAETREATAKKALTALTDLLAAYKANELDKADAPVVTAKVELVRAKIELAAATAELTKAVSTHITAEAAALVASKAKTSNGWVDALKVQLLDPVPDTGRRYILQPQDSKLRSDDFKITTTSSGLLNTVDATLDDQSDEILVAAAQSIASFSNLKTFDLQSVVESLNLKRAACTDYDYVPLSLEFIVDPTNAKDWTDLSTSLNRSTKVTCTSDGSVKTFNFQFSQKASGSAAAYGAHHIDDKVMEGIVYRREIPIVISMTETTTNLASDVILLIPNGAPAEVLELNATSFVKNTAVLGFTQGLLVSVDTKKPSPALVVAGLPAKIVTGMMDTVSSLLTARVNIARQETGLATEQTNLATQRQALLEALEELEAAEREAAGE